MVHDWHLWHNAYDMPDSPLARRLAIVQQCIRDALDAAPQGPIRVLSMCAGQARDLVGALDGHPRASDVHGVVVELDPELAAQARESLSAKIDVVVGDAGMSTAYEDGVPADIALVCGVFGNITYADMEGMIRLLPMFCAPNATVIWTRHRRPPDMTIDIRRRLSELGFEEVAFVAPESTAFGIGAHRFATGTPVPFRPHVRMFEFVGYDVLGDACKACGFSYDMGRGEILPWLRSDAAAFVGKFREIDPSHVRQRPAPDVWSSLEYACHVRDVLRVQRERVRQAQREDEPHFTPMRRDERVVEEGYNEQDPSVVAEEITAAADAFDAALSALDDVGWARRGLYNYPEPQLRTVEWIAIHTVHELLHHRGDIGTLA
jgi:DinB family protein